MTGQTIQLILVVINRHVVSKEVHMDRSLSKSISYFGLIALGAGGVIGSSWIYTNSKFFAMYGAGGEIYGLMVAAALATLVSLSFAELSTIFTKAGGEVVYGSAAFGKKGALFAGWALVGAYISTMAFYVTASSMLISTIFPQIASGPYYEFAGVKVHFTELALGIGITLFVFIINYFGAKIAGNIQIILFIGLIVLGVALITVGFTQGSVSNFTPAFSEHMNKSSSIFRFILPGMTFLTGWESVAIMAEEANVPARKIGLVVIISIVIAAAYYILVLMSSAWVYPWEKTATMEMGTISAFKAAGFPILSIAAYTISFLGLATSFLTFFSSAPRLIFSLARQNVLPSYFNHVHPKYHTPTRALWATLVLVLGLGWLGKGAVVYFLDMGGFLVALAWSFNALCLRKIRKSHPELVGKFRNKHLFWPTLGGAIALIIALATVIPGTLVSLVWPYEYVILGAWIVIGLVCYFITRKTDEPVETEIEQLTQRTD